MLRVWQNICFTLTLHFQTHFFYTFFMRLPPTNTTTTTTTITTTIITTTTTTTYNSPIDLILFQIYPMHFHTFFSHNKNLSVITRMNITFRS